MKYALCDDKTGKVYGYTEKRHDIEAIREILGIDAWMKETIEIDGENVSVNDLVTIPDIEYISAYGESWSVEEIAEQYRQFVDESRYTLTESIEQAYTTEKEEEA